MLHIGLQRWRDALDCYSGSAPPFSEPFPLERFNLSCGVPRTLRSLLAQQTRQVQDDHHIEEDYPRIEQIRVMAEMSEFQRQV